MCRYRLSELMVILDLSYLTASSRERVQNTLHGKTVLITFELIYEIMTNSRGKNPREFLDKLVGLNLVRARSLVTLVNEEVQTERRVTDPVDGDATKRLVEFVNKGQGVSITSDTEQSVLGFFEKQEPQRLRRGLDGMWREKFTNLFAQIERTDIVAAARNYLTLMNRLGDSGLGKSIADEHKMQKQPSPGWLIYEWEQLRNFQAFWFRLHGTKSNQLSDKKLANDLVDLHYLAFLPHAEAIATNDLKRIVPLAPVFGPPSLKVIQPS
jgi:hypothetical protein